MSQICSVLVHEKKKKTFINLHTSKFTLLKFGWKCPSMFISESLFSALKSATTEK